MPLLLFVAIALAQVITAAGEPPDPNVITASERAGLQLETMPNVLIRYYDVHGQDIEAIRRDMDRVRPFEARGSSNRYDLIARTRLQASVRRSGGRPCAIEGVQVTYQTVITLPNLREERSLNRLTRQTWSLYMEAITLHEGGHAQIAAAYAERLKSRLENASCDSAAGIIRVAQSELDRAQRRYDDRTDHGRVQGVSFGFDVEAPMNGAETAADALPLTAPRAGAD